MGRGDTQQEQTLDVSEETRRPPTALSAADIDLGGGEASLLRGIVLEWGEPSVPASLQQLAVAGVLAIVLGGALRRQEGLTSSILSFWWSRIWQSAFPG